MIQKDLSELTDEELLMEGKKIKSTNIVNAVLFGVMIGVATYSTIRNGFGILTFFPLLFIQMLIKNRARKKAFENQLKERNLTIGK
ncbi:FUSC family protein [Kaistella flava (ex Peng et al. 2021)]|uniref:FUSC family protein n=1 Tax=Kaistella flava (ex Peng et al. 2021) TaxID=2038776 RepID=A0A7M2Y4V8_9FLAO|nr:FUSC family protein [Kaistella flava (ex Peng et al. 2021)]QOW08889.1 FUSC family protein [Kaistella flava (ex Peng et al. 2021)]